LETIIKELARFLSTGEEEAAKKVKEYSVKKMAADWEKAPHGTAEEVREFYRTTDNYLYELPTWNSGKTFYEQIRPLLIYREKKILEIGAGIGSLCISLALNGNRITYYDINEKNREFAQQRFADRMLPIEIVESLNGLKDFDIIVAIDTLEHIHPDDLRPLMKEIFSMLTKDGFLYSRSNFGQQNAYPMHYDHATTIKKLAEEIGFTLLPNGDYTKKKAAKGIMLGIPIRAYSIHNEVFRRIMDMEFPIGTTVTTVEGKPVDVARNEIVKKLDRDWLFFMDSDQTFPPGAVARLLSWNKEIVAGLAFKRTGEPIPMFYKYRYEQEKGKYYQPLTMEVGEFLEKHKDLWWNAPHGAVVLPPGPGLLECDGVSAGCLLVHRRVFDAISEPWFKCSEGLQSGEDFDFCRKAQAAGFKIYGDPSVICGHISEYNRSAKHFWIWSMKEPWPFEEEV
jgi:2-polyprenyl-3-methyl-5-hydroxy-6-metoxy-1,4-benzoquinol methylase